MFYDPGFLFYRCVYSAVVYARPVSHKLQEMRISTKRKHVTY